MPTSDIETRLVALHTLIDGAVTGGALRNEATPQSIPAVGLVIQYDGPAQLVGTTMPLAYHYDHDVDLQIHAQAASGREAITDARRQEIGAAIAADRTLGGLCDWVEVQPAETEELRVEGGDVIRIDRIRVTLSYSVSNPLT